jgi:hypothetical protein
MPGTALNEILFLSIFAIETSHAKSKGPQDAAGGFLKNQVDLAVYRGSEIIQSASEFFNYCENHLRLSMTCLKIISYEEIVVMFSAYVFIKSKTISRFILNSCITFTLY